MSGRAPAHAAREGAREPDRAGAARRSGRGRLLALAVTALLPGFLKRAVYRRVFGYEIGSGVRIGVSVLDAARCRIEDGASIGHGNLILGVGELAIGDHARIGYGNILRGGDSIVLARYSEVIRLNVINAIPENDCITNPVPRFTLGAGSVVTSGHRFDFTDTIEIGKRTIVGGRNSSFWTHNRQRTKPIRLGDYVYMGSEVRAAPGVEIPSYCIVGLGSVLIGRITQPHTLISGHPAAVVRPLSEDDEFLVTYRTRADLPEDV
jgi:acetyltransferase-like isoleucine patch superfamily enzyme